MKLRERLNETPWAAVLAVGVIALCLVFIVMSVKGPGAPPAPELWFYDVQAGKLFEASANDVPPIEAPSGGEGVHAKVYTCGGCGEAELKVAELSRYTPEAKAKREEMIRQIARLPKAEGNQLREQLALTSGEGLQSSLPDKIQWQPGSLSRNIRSACGPGGKPRICLPASEN